MKRSRFNVFQEIDGKMYVFNTFSKGMASIDQLHIEALHPNGKGSLSDIEDSFAALSELGILVEDGLDEIGSLRYAYWQSKMSSNELEFVVSPTMDCNFRCTYCFETPRKGKMLESTQDAVFSFVKQKVIDLKPSKIRFIWFGGEPLLAMDVVKSFSKKILSLVDENNVAFNMIVITNGYLITPEVVSALESCGVSAVQITIDGDANVHDKRRILANGEGTYKRIIENLKSFSSSNIEVGIRVNMDKDNVGAFSAVKNAVESIGNCRITCRPALVEPATKHEDEIKRRCYMSECAEFYNSSDVMEYYSGWKLEDLGVQLCFCGAEHCNSYAIDELGNLYKCWNSMGVDSEILGSVFNPDELNESVVSQFFGRDPFSEPDCMDCAYIPICGGGCLEQLKVTGKHACSFQRYIAEQAMRHELR